MTEPPCAKRLRSSQPDLKVILKYTEEEDQPVEEVYQMYGNNLARLSNFIDTALSVEMREKTTREIVIQDVTPKIFEKALQFVQDPRATRSMTALDALEVLEFYNMYEFVGGLELCDDILSEYISRTTITDLNQLVKISAKAHKYNLPGATEKATDYLNSEIFSKHNRPIRAAMLTIEHIQMLQPMFKDGLLMLPPTLSKEDVDNSLFSKYFVKCMSCKFFAGTSSLRTSMALHGGGELVSPWDKFSLDAITKEWESGNGIFTICKGDPVEETSDWNIKKHYRGNVTVFWEAPNSQDLDVPPPGPWEPVDARAAGIRPLLIFD